MGILKSIKDWNDAHKPKTTRETFDEAKAQGMSEDEAWAQTEKVEKRRRARRLATGIGLGGG